MALVSLREESVTGTAMDISKIIGRLYLSAELQASHIEKLADLNIHTIISMIGGRYPPEVFIHTPYHLTWLQTFDSILLPIPISKLMQGVRIALPFIQKGDSVLVYCAQGRHRSVAMAAAILIATGYTANDAIDLLCTKREVADPKIWHIHQRIQFFENCWRNETSHPDGFIKLIGETYSEHVTSLASSIIRYHMLLSKKISKNTHL